MINHRRLKIRQDSGDRLAQSSLGTSTITDSPATGELPLAVSPMGAARLAGVGRSTIYLAITSGELPSIKLGKRRLILVEALLAWLKSHEAAS